MPLRIVGVPSGESGGAPGVGSVGIPVWKLYGKTTYRELKANFISNVCLRTQEFHCKN